MGIKQKIPSGAIKTLELGVAAMVGAVASKLIEPLWNINLWNIKYISTLVIYSFAAAFALLAYCALGLFLIYLIEPLAHRADKEKEKS